jgi:hypothetical protein
MSFVLPLAGENTEYHLCSLPELLPFSLSALVDRVLFIAAYARRDQMMVRGSPILFLELAARFAGLLLLSAPAERISSIRYALWVVMSISRWSIMVRIVALLRGPHSVPSDDYSFSDRRKILMFY